MGARDTQLSIYLIQANSQEGRSHCLMRSSRGRHSSVGQPSAPPSGSFRPTLAAGSRFCARRSNALRNGRSGANEGPSRAKHPTRAYASTWRRACAGCSSGHKGKRPLARHPAHPRATSHGTFGLRERGLDSSPPFPSLTGVGREQRVLSRNHVNFCCELAAHMCHARAVTKSI